MKHVGQKVCGQCGTRKPTAEFYARKGSPDGLTGACSECMKRYSLEYRNRPGKRGLYNERSKVWRKAHPEQVSRTNRRNQLRILYGLTVEAYTAMLQVQFYKCAACGDKFDMEAKQKTPHIDHNHKTGEVRALLCGHCNAALGNVHESVDKLKALIAYLEQHNGLN